MKKYMYPAALALALLASTPAGATADGPDAWEARAGEPIVLKVEPRADAADAGSIPGGTRGLRNLGCQGRPDLNAWLAMSDADRKAARAKIWCRTKFAGHEGWINSADLTEPSDMAPAFDCGRAEGAVEELLCRDGALARLDQEMADVYWSAMGVAATSGAGKQQAMATEKTMQRGWIKGRNDCWKASDVPECVKWSYWRRLAELEVRWNQVDAEKPDVYRCDGGIDVSATRYKTTHTGAIAVEAGGTREIYVQSLTASGVKYDGPFGRFLWNKGRSARVKLTPDGAELQCELK